MAAGINVIGTAQPVTARNVYGGTFAGNSIINLRLLEHRVLLRLS